MGAPTMHAMKALLVAALATATILCGAAPLPLPTTSSAVSAGASKRAPRDLGVSLRLETLPAALRSVKDFDVATWLHALGGELRDALPLKRAAESGGSFKDYFVDGVNADVFKFVDGYSNGYPFNNGWRAGNHEVKGGVLSLVVTKDAFKDWGSATGGGREYPYTSAEVRSEGYFSEGCYATCMKPSGVSGVSSSFYIHSGEHDVPPGIDPKSHRKHQEIDVEFVGKNSRLMQSNFYDRFKVPQTNSGTGAEEMHELGFDAAEGFHVYGFRWTRGGIEWYVDGKEVRRVNSSDIRIKVPSPIYGPMRIAANAWPVRRELEKWAGPLNPNVNKTSSSYKWIKFAKSADCQVPSRC